MKTVLVTGARGFVGSHLIKELLQSKYYVVAITSSSKPLTTHDNLLWEQCDIQSADDVESLFNKYSFEEIYHLAAKAITTSQNVQEYYQVNTLGTINLLNQLDKKQFKGKVLLTSTSFVYGANCDNPINELTTVNPLNDYAASKAAMEVAALSFINRGLYIIIARPFNHTGPNQSEQYVCSDFARQFAQIKIGKRLAKLNVGNITLGRDFTDVRDIVKGYKEIMKSSITEGIFNFCSAKPIKILTIIETLKEISGIEVEINEDKNRLRKNEIQEIYGDYSKVYQAIKWEPTISIEETLYDLYKYWLDRETFAERR